MRSSNKKSGNATVKRSRVVRLAIIVFSILWTIFAAEWYLRLFAPLAMLPRYVQAAPYGIRMNVPSLEYYHRTPDYEVRIRTNSRGVRAETEIPYQKKLGTKRVLLLGDSFGMGYGVNLENTFFHHMCNHLESAGYPGDIDR